MEAGADLPGRTPARQLSGRGLSDAFCERNLDIVQQDREATALRRGSISRSWPLKSVAGDCRNEVDENFIGAVPLTHESSELVQP